MSTKKSIIFVAVIALWIVFVEATRQRTTTQKANATSTVNAQAAGYSSPSVVRWQVVPKQTEPDPEPVATSGKLWLVGDYCYLLIYLPSKQAVVVDLKTEVCQKEFEGVK